MLTGTCGKCGQVFHGWALQGETHRVCECGGHLTIEQPQKLYALSRANLVDLVEYAVKELFPRRCPHCDDYIGYEDYLERKDFERVIKKYLEPERLCPACHANMDAWFEVFGTKHKC